MLNQFSRTELLLGKDAMEQLENKRVAIFGIGGVGGYVCEALVRTGIGHFDLIDNDNVSITNINRQIIATHSTVDRNKVDVMRERMLDINPDVDITVHKCFFLPENAEQFDFKSYDYVVDAVDTVTAKIEIIMRCKAEDVPVISCMGAGNKVDPTQFHVADISRTSVCPLARVMRRELQKRGIKRLKCLYSTEKIIPPEKDENYVDEVNENEASSQEDQSGNTRSKSSFKKQTPGSNAFVPSVAGLIIAGEVLKDLTSFHVTNLFPPVKK